MTPPVSSPLTPVGRALAAVVRFLVEPLSFRGHKLPVTATLAWNLMWVAAYACSMAWYGWWMFATNDRGERLRSIEVVQARARPVWTELYHAFEAALPADTTPVPTDDPRPTLKRLVLDPLVVEAYFISPKQVLTVAHRHRERLSAPLMVTFMTTDLKTWRPTARLLPKPLPSGPWRPAYLARRYAEQDQENLAFALMRGDLMQKRGAIPTFETYDLLGRYQTNYLKGSVAGGYLGYEAYAGSFPGPVGDEILRRHGLAGIVEWNRPNDERKLLAPTHWLPSAIRETTLSWDVDGLEAIDSELNRHAALMLLLPLVLLGLRMRGAVQDFRTLLQERSLALAQSNFVSAVSHEMRTPLTTIRMYAEMLEQEVVTDPDRRKHYLATIASECERLGRLVENVLDYARISGKRKAYRFEAVDARALVEEALAAVAGPLELAGLVVEVHAPVPVLARVDRDAVVQSLVNLLGNAIKYAAAGRRLVVSALPTESGGVALAVEDFGPGIEPAEQQNVFKPFYRVGNELTRTATGSGLGLALVAETARAHQGRVELDSVPGRGSAFRLVLPPADERADQPRVPA